MSLSAVLPRKSRNLVIAGIASAIAIQIFLLVLSERSNLYLINPDGISYILLARHYLKGEFALAVSGYWSPLITWMMLPSLGLGQDPLVAARIIASVAAFVFLCGCISVFRSIQMQPSVLVLATWIVAVQSILWSNGLTPDLLVCGLLCFGVSLLISTAWVESRRVQLLTGIILGTAYLAKAIALPVGIALTIALASFWTLTGTAKPRISARGVLITLLGILLIAGPWIVVLSVKYRSFVLSTSAKVNHAIAGPPNVERMHPGHKSFHTPEAGRIWAWEDPPSLRYEYWSPFESWEYFKFQLGLIYHNSRKVIDYLSGFDYLHIGLVAALLGLCVHTPWHDNIAQERWRWAAVVLICMSVFYLPVYAGSMGDERYYYDCYPFLIIASFGLVESLTRTQTGLNLARLAGIALVSLSFLYSPVTSLMPTIHGLDNRPIILSYDLARKLHALRVDGEIAAVGTCLGDV